MNKAEIISDVVCTYVGPIYSEGSVCDKIRLENLKTLIYLIDSQIDEVTEEYLSTIESFEGSRQKSNKVCKEYLLNLEMRIKELLDE